MKLSQDNPNGAFDGECACLPRPHDPKAGPGSNPNSPADARPTTTYVLRYQDAWFGMEKRVAFEADDVAAALAMMEREPIGEWAELLKDGEVICRRGREPGGAADYWVID